MLQDPIPPTHAMQNRLSYGEPFSSVHHLPKALAELSPTSPPGSGRLFKFRLDKQIASAPQSVSPETTSTTIKEFSNCLVTEKYVDYSNKNAKRRKRMVEIPAHKIVSHLIFPASFAAKRLGVSVSTLKRRLVELDCGSGRWPVGETQPFPRGIIKTNRKRVIMKDLLNEMQKEEEVKQLTDVTESVLRCAFRQHLFDTL